MQFLKKTPVKIFLTGTIAALLLLVVGLVFLNSGQCPTNYTQQQIDASGCVVGANIGLGLVKLLAGAIWVVTILTTLLMVIFSKRKK